MACGCSTFTETRRKQQGSKINWCEYPSLPLSHCWAWGLSYLGWQPGDSRQRYDDSRNVEEDKRVGKSRGGAGKGPLSLSMLSSGCGLYSLAKKPKNRYILLPSSSKAFFLREGIKIILQCSSRLRFRRPCPNFISNPTFVL